MERVRFTPALTEIQDAANRLAMGQVVKLYCDFVIRSGKIRPT